VTLGGKEEKSGRKGSKIPKGKVKNIVTGKRRRKRIF